MRPTRILSLGLFMVTLLPAVAQAQNTACYRGGALLPNFTLNGATLSGTDILVTPDAGNQLASVFFNPTFDPTKNLYIKMVFKITTTVTTGADGMAFVLQNDSRGVNAIGLAGEGIGYGYHNGTPAAPAGEVVISPSVVVEFDTFYNARRNDPADPNDITYGHIGLTLNGDPNHADFPAGYLKDLLGTGYVLKSNAPMYAWLDYTASNTTLNVYLNNVNTKPATPMLSTTAINLATQLGSKFYMGFSGSTGGSQSKHEVMQFYASDSSTQPDTDCCNADSDCASSSLGPVCDPQKHVCGQCTVANTSQCSSQPSACNLSGVSNTCVPDCNGNYGSGTTQACVSANFPFCRTSGTGAGSCEVCAGDYGAGSSPACAVNSPYCSVVGYCGFCTTDADCTASGPTHSGVHCNTANGQCVTCLTTLDCTNATMPVCNAATNTCVACSGNYGSGGNACQTTTLPACLGTGACVECKTSPAPADTTACTATGAVCNNATHQCTSCDGDFGSGTTHSCSTAAKPVCILSSGVCVQCTTAKASQCTGNTPVCNAVTNTCGACNGDYGSNQSLPCTSTTLPACLSTGACAQCSANNSTLCTGSTPVCNTTTDTCAQCSSYNYTACTGTTPVCNTATDSCVACNGDFGSGQSHACLLSATPACITSGALSGSCTQCSSTNTSLCVASDQCHQGGVCNTTTGLCANPAKSDGTTCNDGNACTQTDTCQSGTCTGSNPVVCSALNQCHVAGVCNTSTGVCSNPTQPDGTGCNDGNACTQTDTCQLGTCTGSNPVVCSALDQCHVAGVCNTSTGVCSNPTQPNGTGCNDGNACTLTDICQAGICIGGNPVVCSALDQCHQAGVCDPLTSLCSNPIQPNGTGCNDGNACTQTDTCQAGTCIGSNPVVCVAQDQCHDVGVCNTSTGVCSNPNKTNGTSCNDGNACTQTDTCQAGTCTGSNPVVCVAQDQCHQVGTCNPSTGVCSNPAKSNGAACNDGNACTQTDTCQSGTCTGSNPVVCSALDQCHVAGVCNPSSGVCSNPNITDGTTCNDGNACTQTDTCQSGTCTGSNPVVCSALDQCHVAGVCNTSTGVCSNPNIADGTSCNDGNACTQADTCTTGVCAGVLVVCVAQDECHTAGTCNQLTGCSNPTKPDGTSCDSGQGTCLSGVCNGQSCTDSSQCPSTYCVDGYCCNQACAGQCEACNLPGALGNCGAVTGAPQSPRPACANDNSGCGGQCDGTLLDANACVYPTTQCRSPQCVDGIATLAASCYGGACPSIITQPCDPYICGPSQCEGNCFVDQDCIAGYFCSAGVCQPTLPPGQPCSGNDQCVSGYCVDGYCCDLPCTGQCEACNLTASVGTCTAVSGAPVGVRPPCYPDGGVCGGSCNGQRRDGCFYPWTETECRTASCQNNVATLGAVCNGAGSCSPLITQPCTPYQCGLTQCQGNCLVDADCPSGSMCSAGVCVPKYNPGTACDSDNECLSGFCADGVCCNQACFGQCEACNLTASRGTCSAVTGAPQPGHAPCVGAGTVCAGGCDGITMNQCSYPGADTVCRLPSCQNGVAILSASCDNAGHCPDLLQRICSPSSCNGNFCPGNCMSDTDCLVANQYCSGGVCVSKIPQGSVCDSAAHCATGFCVDGVCCNQACLGQCEACNLTASAGTCTAVTGVPSGSRAPCVGERACQGSCDGITRDVCAFPGATVTCQDATCANAIANAASTCDGAGSCEQPTSQSCGAYVCDATTCKTSCATDKDCGDAYYCVHSQCADHVQVSGGGCNCGTGDSDRGGLLLVLLGLVMLAIKRRVR